MKILEKNVRDKLKDVHPMDRVWIYDAHIILEFLNRSFIPTKFFLKPDLVVHAGQALDKDSFQDPGKLRELEMEIDKLYDMYLVFRENMDYTAPIEKAYRFKAIVRKMRYYKNGWEFLSYRRGRKQLQLVTPLLPRNKASQIVRDQFPAKKPVLVEGQVDLTLEDMSSPEPKENTASDLKKEIGNIDQSLI